MSCERFREHLPALLDGRHSAAETSAVRHHVDQCAGCQAELNSLQQSLAALDRLPPAVPSPRLRARVHAAISAEQRNQTAKPAAAIPPGTLPAASLPWFRGWGPSALAACALLGLGFAAGFFSRSPAITPNPADNSTAVATQRELAALRAQVESMSTLVGYSVLQQQSRPSNERLREILLAARSENPDSKAINELIGALALDPSTNVRLNALEALYPHADQKAVREGVLVSLPREPSPLVQVSMIDFLVATRDRNAAPTLQKLSDSDQIDRAVRDAARRALTQL